MKQMKTIEVPATTIEVVDRIMCDLCGTEIKTKSFVVDEVEVHHRTGTADMDGGEGEELCVDICGYCFDTRLIPWLRTQGADPKPQKWEW